MATTIRRADYVHVTIRDRPKEAYRLLEHLAAEGVSLLAFNAVPVGPAHTQLVLFPDDLDRLRSLAKGAGLAISEPLKALLIQGDDKLGALAEIHRQLSAASVQVFASSGVADGRGGYGYVIHVRPEEFGKAAQALGI